MNEKELPVYTLEPEVSSIVSCLDEDGNILSLDRVSGNNTRNFLNNMRIPYDTKLVLIEFDKPTRI